MTKLEEAAKEHRADCWGDEAFIAGALWHQRQAKRIAMDDMQHTTVRREPDMRAIELVRRLEELCEGKE